MAITYAEILAAQKGSRKAFGQMLLSWRRRNGWTQYTACDWGKEAGFEMISYGNLSVIEQGKAGELRQKVFWQLWELNRRIADQDWGTIKTLLLKDRVRGATPLGDEACPVWTALEFWGCYCGFREVPPDFRDTPPPSIRQSKATELSSRWRKRMRQVVNEHQLDPSYALQTLQAMAGLEHGKRFYAVLTGFDDYRPEELVGLWVEGETFQPQLWLDRWAATQQGNL